MNYKNCISMKSYKRKNDLSDIHYNKENNFYEERSKD